MCVVGKWPHVQRLGAEEPAPPTFGTGIGTGTEVRTKSLLRPNGGRAGSRPRIGKWRWTVRPSVEVEGFVVPDDLLYDVENDVWLRLEADERSATVGLTASLVSFAGRFTHVSFRPVEGLLPKGRSLGTVESIRFTGAVRMPVDGSILERNETLRTRPRLLNDSPYEAGWVARIAPTAPGRLTEELATADRAREAIQRKIREMRIRCYPASPDLEVYEIGAECAAILSRLDDELARRAGGDVLLLVTDDPTSPIEMVRWQDRSGHTVLQHRVEGNLHHFLIRREAHPKPRRR